MQATQENKQNVLPVQQYLTFFTAGEEYAFDLLKVREVIEYTAVTAVPDTPSWIRGVTNLRGSVLPVVDLAIKFGLPASAITKFSCVVVTEVEYEGESLTMGVLADSVSQVMDFSANDIEAPPPFGTRVRIEYLLGMGRMGRKFCLILDVDKVLGRDELLAVVQATTEEGAQMAAGTAGKGA
jgi:purine-binding chemotaxis protein CheW